MQFDWAGDIDTFNPIQLQILLMYFFIDMI